MQSCESSNFRNLKQFLRTNFASFLLVLCKTVQLSPFSTNLLQVLHSNNLQATLQATVHERRAAVNSNTNHMRDFGPSCLEFGLFSLHLHGFTSVSPAFSPQSKNMHISPSGNSESAAQCQCKWLWLSDTPATRPSSPKSPRRLGQT